MQNKVKILAVNLENENLADVLKKCSNSVYEIDSDLLEKRTESYTTKGLSSITLIGNLSKNPKPMVDPIKVKEEKVDSKKEDYVNNKNYIYLSEFCYETNVYWDKQEGKRHAINNYINLIFCTRGAKYAIKHYRQGDGLIVNGYLRSNLEINPLDKTRKINVQYMVVTSFSANPGTHIRKQIEDKFFNEKFETKYQTVAEVLNDRSISREQQDKLLIALARKEYCLSDEQKNNSEVENNNSEKKKNQNTIKKEVNSDKNVETSKITVVNDSLLSKAFEDEFWKNVNRK